MKPLLARLKVLLQKRYRIILVDDASYEQAFYYSFTLGRLAGLLGLVVGAIIFFNSTLIVFTPLREWIPGYTDPQFKAKQTELLSKVNDMEQLIARQESFIKSLQRVSGYVPTDSAQLRQAATGALGEEVSTTSTKASTAGGAVAPTVVSVRYSPAVSTGSEKISFQWPVEGLLTNRFSDADRHYAIDLAAPQHTAIRSVADGRVVLAEYSDLTGYVLGVQHPDGFLSFYKHNSALFKKVGSFVFGGEAIAIIGNSGENTTGTHLHFELWQNGKPVDPLLFMDYKEGGNIH